MEQDALLPVTASRLAELEQVVASAEAALTVEAARWLLARGVTPETAAGFRLGVVADALPGFERFSGMLCIPYLTPDGRPLSVRFRCLERHEHREHFHGKYNSLTGEPSRVFNVGGIVNNRTDELHITEGEFDAMILNQAGLPAVAIPGAQAWRPHHRRMVAGFSRVWVWGDPDEAGAQFNEKVRQSVRVARVVRLARDDGDVSELYARGGEAALRARLQQEEVW